MNKHLELLLQLEDLILLREGLQLTGAMGHEARFDDLDDRINALRQRLPGAVLSQFDVLARKYGNPLTTVSHRACQGCQERIPARTLRLVEESFQLLQCEHCGRFLVPPESAPDYIPVS